MWAVTCQLPTFSVRIINSLTFAVDAVLAAARSGCQNLFTMKTYTFFCFVVIALLCYGWKNASYTCSKWQGLTVDSRLCKLSEKS